MYPVTVDSDKTTRSEFSTFINYMVAFSQAHKSLLSNSNMTCIHRPWSITVNTHAGRPKSALLFWFFGDFRCGVLLFMVILVYINIKGGKNSC